MSKDKHEAEAAEPKSPAVQMGRGVVERGKTVCVPQGSKTVGHMRESGREIKGPARYIEFGPGQEVELPVEEIKFLRERGFLIDPDKKLTPKHEGPSIQTF